MYFLSKKKEAKSLKGYHLTNHLEQDQGPAFTHNAAEYLRIVSPGTPFLAPQIREPQVSLGV